MIKSMIAVAIFALCVSVSTSTTKLRNGWRCKSDLDCSEHEQCHQLQNKCEPRVRRYEETRRFMRRVIDGRIVGGKSVSINHVPWQVSITDTFGYHFCGGAIVSKWFIITAAHCLADDTAENIQIRTGSSDNGHGGMLTKVARIKTHELYGTEGVSTTDYDIALIQLKEPLEFAQGIDAITLAKKDDTLADGESVYVSGWGQLSETGLAADDLQTVVVPVINQNICDVSYRGVITERMFCAGYPDGGKDACKGDSGGPAMVNGKLVGLVSWGDGCARGGNPGVYTRISSLRDWWDANAVLQ